MRRHGLILVSLALFLPSYAAWGQNMALNPDFKTDVTLWLATAKASLAWDALDAAASPASGSALVTGLGDSPNDSNGAYQCIDGINGGVFYHFAADMLIPSGQSETGHAHLLIQWYSNADCAVNLGVDYTYGLESTTTDQWFTDVGYAQAPPGTQSARLRLSVWKNEAVGSLDAHFDNVEFEAMVFADGFESGDSLAWSNTIP